MTNEVYEFLKKYDACEDGFTWAVENCKTMEEVWNTAKPEWFIWLATIENVLPEMDLHRFACWSVRQIWDLLKDERSRNAIEVKERWIEGKATDEELDAARDAAWAAAGAATRAGAAARAAAVAAAVAAVRDAAWAAALAAARAGSAAVAASRKKQAKYIRNTFTPNFK